MPNGIGRGQAGETIVAVGHVGHAIGPVPTATCDNASVIIRKPRPVGRRSGDGHRRKAAVAVVPAIEMIAAGPALNP